MSTSRELPLADELEKICLDHEEDPNTASFDSFSKLPAELRLMVWEFAISEKQIASLTELSGIESSDIDDDIKYGRLPAFLFVNKECRDVALRMNRYPIRFTFRPVTARLFPDDPIPRTLQRCRIGPDDIVAVRVEKKWYPIWEENWKIIVDKSFPSGSYSIPMDFRGKWGGDYDSIENWMMLVPLNVFHFDDSHNTELNRLGSEICRHILLSVQTQFKHLFHKCVGLGPLPEISEEVHYVVYGWEQPKKENLTAYELESIQDCRKYLSIQF
jgi:hypothetical protein